MRTLIDCNLSLTRSRIRVRIPTFSTLTRIRSNQENLVKGTTISFNSNHKLTPLRNWTTASFISNYEFASPSILIELDHSSLSRELEYLTIPTSYQDFRIGIWFHIEIMILWSIQTGNRGIRIQTGVWNWTYLCVGQLYKSIIIGIRLDIKAGLLDECRSFSWFTSKRDFLMNDVSNDVSSE